MLFICYARCSTCRKAEKWLLEHDIAPKKRDIKEQRPTRSELEAWHRVSGLPLKRFWNTSGGQYRALGLKDKLSDMSPEEQYDLMATDGLLVRRPLLIGDGFVLVGFKEAEWHKMLAAMTPGG